MKTLFIFFFSFSTLGYCQEYRTDTIRYYETIHASFASPLKIEITYREDLKRPRMKILKGSYIGNIKWLASKENLERLKEDVNIYISRRMFRKIMEEVRKIKLDEIMPDWDYENIILDGSSTELYFSNWFETNKPLELNFSNSWIDAEERGLVQYNRVLELIDKTVRYDLLSIP